MGRLVSECNGLPPTQKHLPEINIPDKDVIIKLPFGAAFFESLPMQPKKNRLRFIPANGFPKITIYVKFFNQITDLQ